MNMMKQKLYYLPNGQISKKDNKIPPNESHLPHLGHSGQLAHLGHMVSPP